MGSFPSGSDPKRLDLALQEHGLPREPISEE